MDHEVKTSVNAHLILTGRGIFGPIFELNDNNFMDFTVSFMLLWGFLGIPINGDGDFSIFYIIPKNPKNPHVSSPVGFEL